MEGEEWPSKIGDAASKGLGVRHLQAVLMALMTFLSYSLRVNVSVAIVAMTGMDQTSNNETSIYPVYKWGEDIQGLVLSSFFWGYTAMQVPSGILTARYGGHLFLCGAIFSSSLLTVLTPPCAYFGGWQLVCANRMVQGLAQGLVFPAAFTLLGKWVLPNERGCVSGFVIGAQVPGTVIASPIAGYLTAYFGWPSVFYCFGIFGMAVAAIAAYFGSDSPATHRFISTEERNFIENSLGGDEQKMKVPWRRILTSVPVWAAMLTVGIQAGVFMTFVTEVPTYLGTVLNFDMEDNGLISALPYLVCWITTSICSWACDFITNRGLLTLTASRKMFNSIAHVGCAFFIVLMGYSSSTALSVFLLTMSLGSFGAGFPGVETNFIDLAPNYSGTLYSMGNLLASAFGMFGPIVIGWIITEPGSTEQWRIVFILCASVMFLGNVIFLIFGTAETQDWNWVTKS